MTKLHSSNLAKMAAKVDENALQKLRGSYQASGWVRYMTRPLLQTILILSLMGGILALVATVTTDDRWSLLMPLFFFIILEAIYTTNWIKHPARLGLDRSTYRAAELLLLIIIVRLATWVIFDGGLPDREQFIFFLGNPLPLFLNGHFLVTVLLSMIAWRLANLVADIFIQLEVSEYELRFYSMPLALRKERADDQPIYTSRHELVLRFAQFWLWGGILLALTTGLSTLEISSLASIKNPLAIGRLGLPPGLLFALLLYFGVGFYLLSQAKLMEMNSRWLLNEFDRDDRMQKNWQRSSLILLLLVGLIAAFLPIGPNLAIGRILYALLYVIFLLVNVILFIVTLPIVLLYFLFPGQTAEQAPGLPPLVPEGLPEGLPPEATAMNETVALVLSSIFWAVFLFVAVLALWLFLRERKHILQDGMGRAVWARFWEVFKDYWLNWWRRIEKVNLSLPSFSSKKEKGSKDTGSERHPWRFFRLGALNPRDQIRYFYLSTVRRAGEKGVKREQSETPLEYAEDLKEGWPTVEEEVEQLTDAFLKARYSADPITEEDLPAVKKTWKGVRRQLKEESQQEEESEE